MGSSEAWIALLAALAGGSVLKIVEYFLTRPERKSKAEADLRTAIREEVEGYKAEARECRDNLRKAEADTDAWREKYFSLLAKKSGEE